jgi:hypothetical protein
LIWRVEELEKISTSDFSQQGTAYKSIKTNWFKKKEEAYKFYLENKDKKPLSYPVPVSEVKV